MKKITKVVYKYTEKDIIKALGLKGKFLDLDYCIFDRIIEIEMEVK